MGIIKVTNMTIELMPQFILLKILQYKEQGVTNAFIGFGADKISPFIDDSSEID